MSNHSLNTQNPFWLAERHGHDWRDEDIVRAIRWLTSTVAAHEWTRRIDTVRENFESAKRAWANRERVALYDPQDLIAWYIFQANAYATDRVDAYEPESYRIAPLFTRLGRLLPALEQVNGASERALSLMTRGRRQADDGLFELLVAGAYKNRSWASVEFVAEKPGIEKTPDLAVATGRRRWAVECKRVGQSQYELRERERAEALAQNVHQFCLSRGLSLVVEVRFERELFDVDDYYLANTVEASLGNRAFGVWADEHSRGRVRHIDWRLAHTVMAHDDIFFGSSRMIQLLTGHYYDQADHSVAAQWTPAVERPLFATSVRQASVVSWTSESLDATRSKAKHFRSLVAKAAKQLPGDRPGVVHIGCETRGGNSAHQMRHFMNAIELSTFEADEARLRYVYGHYFTAEHTTARGESAALSETTATYKIGQQGTAQPVRNLLLFSDDEGLPGTHWP